MRLYSSIQEIKTANTKYDLHENITSRWSPRMFSTEPIGMEELNALFEAARWAASSNNEQPWRFLYAFKGTPAYDKIVRCLSDFNKKWVRHAPVLLLTAIKEKFDSGKPNYHALHDLGLAMGNMTQEAQSRSIALHHMAGVDWEKAQEVFGVPAGYHIVTAVAVGFYGGDASELPENLEKMEHTRRERLPLEAVVFKGAWPSV